MTLRHDETEERPLSERVDAAIEDVVTRRADLLDRLGKA